MIVTVTLAYEEVAEEFAQMGIFRSVVKAQGTDVVKISRKFLRQTLAQLFYTNCPLLFQDEFLPLLMVCGLETLPGERGPEEVEKHVP